MFYFKNLISFILKKKELQKRQQLVKALKNYVLNLNSK